MTDDELRGLVDRATFLHERLEPAWQPFPNPFDSGTVAARLARWRQVAAGGDDERFTRRLAWLGLDERSAARILGAGGYASGRPQPDWAAFLAQTLDSAADARAAGIVPAFVCAAESRLAQAAGETLAWLAPAARRSLSETLRGRLERLAQAALAENDSRSLTARSLESHCLAYPVLARQLAQHCLDWTAEVADFLQRLAGDWPDLARYLRLPPRPLPAVVADLTPGLSDPHRGGRTVWRVLLSGVQPVAYKPKNLAMDRAWNDLLAWCHERGLSPQLGTLWVLARPEHGWMEWADEDGDGSGDPRQWGMLLGLLHLLHGADCHRENLVVRNGQPLLIDAEMLCYPQVAGVEEDDPLDVLRTGLLPRWAGTEAGWADIGGLRRGEAPPAGVAAGYRYIRAFLRRHWAALTADEGPLRAFRQGAVRFAPRPTAAYLRLLEHLRQPALLRDGIELSIEADRLAYSFLASPEREALHPLLTEEHAALVRGDVPLFRVPVGQPTFPAGAEGGGAGLGWPPFLLPTAAAEERETHLIRESLDAAPYLAGMPGEGAGFLAWAQALGEMLIQRAVPLAGGGLGWIAPHYRPASGLWQHGLVGDDLYAGRAGIALFLAGLYRATGEERWRTLALSALRPERPERRLPDGGGQLYALVLCSHLLRGSDSGNRPPDHPNIPVVLADSRNHRIHTHRHAWGVLDGQAGVLLGLLALYKQTANAALLEQAVTCGNRLLAEADGWQNPVTGLGGFSHGTAGIAYALAKLYKAMGEARFLDGAQRGWDFQRTLYAEPPGRWQDRRGATPVYLDNWCNGAAGIGLAAAGCLAVLPGLAEVTERAGALLMDGQTPFLDTLCCGGFGQIDSLLEMGLRLGRPAWIDGAIVQARQVLARASAAGHFALYDDLPSDLWNPGFFRGVAGIGYTLLRLAGAHREMEVRLPSVLSWSV